MTSNNPFHEGELAVQTRAGESQNARMTGGAINDRISGRAMQFIERQPMVVVGTLDSKGRAWASVLFGEPGFLHAENDHTLALDRAELHSVAGDPVWDNLEANTRVGLLLIELESRRRFRINGRVHSALEGRLIVDVEHAYGNCPKYIQGRRWRLPGTKPSRRIRPSRHGAQLSIAQQAWITSADTFFVASAHPQQGMDASHRGGRPGFVEVLNPHRLRIPDYAGNGMFNTLGNFTSYPHAGLLFIDFARHRILQLTGRPELVWDARDERGETGGTNRYWEFEIEAWQEAESRYHLEWELIDYSPFIPTVRELGNSAGVQALRLKVERIWVETDRVKGFQLTAADGGDLPMFESGAHLPIMVRDKSGNWVERHYSLLSDSTDRSCYRIGVLAELQGCGGSLYLHESVQAGDTLNAMPPRNSFPLEINAQHSILLAGGIGITPILSMLHALKAAGKSFELHYSAKRRSDLAFRQKIESLIGERAHFYVSQEPVQERIDLKRILAEPLPDTHVYVCGPRRMITSVLELARTAPWPMERIHYESFGITQSPDDTALTIRLSRSGKTLTVPASRSILDALLDVGLAVPYDCKRGECSLCITRVLEGEPEHRDLCLSKEEHADSMCICVSRAKTDGLTLDL